MKKLIACIFAWTLTLFGTQTFAFDQILSQLDASIKCKCNDDGLPDRYENDSGLPDRYENDSGLPDRYENDSGLPDRYEIWDCDES